MSDYPIWPSTLPPCPVASGIIGRLAEAGPDYVERMWAMSDQEMQTIRDLSALFFAEGFAVSREGFNAESMSKCGPDGLSLSELSDATIDCILEDEKINGNASLDGLRWIPVSERLPPADGSIVLAYYWHAGRGDGSVWQAVYAEEIGGWRCQDAEECDYGVPTHWMPLPEPPSA